TREPETPKARPPSRGAGLKAWGRPCPPSGSAVRTGRRSGFHVGLGRFIGIFVFILQIAPEEVQPGTDVHDRLRFTLDFRQEVTERCQLCDVADRVNTLG